MDGDLVQHQAMLAYWYDDPCAVSLNSICAKAGAPKPSVYREFGSEDGLQRAVLDRYAQTVLADVLTIFETGGGSAQILQAVIDFACDGTRFDRGCLFFKMRAAKPRLGPLTGAMLEHIQSNALLTIEHALTLDKAGRIGLDAPLVAHYILEQMGLAMSLRAQGIKSDQCRAMMQVAFAPLGWS